MAQFNINNADVVGLTNRLEKIHKSAMPVSVRGALNDAAFDMKKNQLGKTFDSSFTIRKKTFIRSHSAFNRSKNTFNINEMSSEAGIIKDKSKSGNELEIQETGGIVGDRDYIPLSASRINKSSLKLVSKRFYLQNIKPRGKKVKKNEFVRAAFRAKRGGFIQHKGFVFRINKIKKEGNRLNIDSERLYLFQNNRSIDLSATHFVEKAGELSLKKIPEFFLKQAKRRLNK